MNKISKNLQGQKLTTRQKVMKNSKKSTKSLILFKLTRQIGPIYKANMNINRINIFLKLIKKFAKPKMKYAPKSSRKFKVIVKIAHFLQSNMIKRPNLQGKI